MTTYSTYLKVNDGLIAGSIGDNSSASRASVSGVAPQPLLVNNMAADYGIVQVSNVYAFKGDGSIYFRLPVSSGGVAGNPANSIVGTDVYSGCQIFDITLDSEAATPGTGFTINAYLVQDPTVASTTEPAAILLVSYNDPNGLDGGEHYSIISQSRWASGTAVQFAQNTCFQGIGTASPFTNFAGTKFPYLRLDITGSGGTWQHYTVLYGVRYFYN